MRADVLGTWLSTLATTSVGYTRVAAHRYQPWGDQFSPLGILIEMAHREKVCERRYMPEFGTWQYDGLEIGMSQRVMLWADISHNDMTYVMDVADRVKSHEEAYAILSEHTFTSYELPTETEYYAHA